MENLDKLFSYIEFLEKGNSKINLVSYKSIRDFYSDHILDSLSIAEVLNIRGRIADIGSGPGLPGLILSLFFPLENFILIEPRKKYSRFLQKCRSRMKLKNIELLKMPAEKDKDIKTYNMLLFRAVGTADEICGKIEPAPGTLLVFYKAGNIFREFEQGIPSGYSLLCLKKIKILETYNKNHYIAALKKN